jgi:plastocyanin
MKGQSRDDRWLLLTLWAIVVMMGVAARGQSAESQQPSADEGKGDAAAVVDMTNSLKFVPERVVVQTGDTVLWTNNSDVVHTVTADPERARAPMHVQLPAGAEPFDSGDIEAGEHYRRTFEVAGTYRYFCIPHERAGMIGTVIVEAADGSPDADDRSVEGGHVHEHERADGGTDESSARRTAMGADPDRSQFVRWIGKFHPPMINFPIGLMVAAALAELLLMSTRRPTFEAAARYCLWFGALGAIAAGVLGWCLAGFQLRDARWIMTTHRWLGTATVAWSILVLVLSERSRGVAQPRKGRGMYRFTLFVGALVVLATGFFGGALIYGIDHYAWPG